VRVAVKWYEVTSDRRSRPNHYGAVWLYVPDLGNDDEGWGTVIVGRCTLDIFVTTYVDEFGKDVKPSHWAFIDYPDPPCPPSDTRPPRQ
jgi:hypothetical protein